MTEIHRNRELQTPMENRYKKRTDESHGKPQKWNQGYIIMVQTE